MSMLHQNACVIYSKNMPMAPALVPFSLVQATALKPPREAGRRGGDSIARGQVFNYAKWLRWRVVVALDLGD